MKVSKNIQDNKFQISMDEENSIENLRDWDIRVMKILSLAKDKKVSLITISPQSYSLGEELGNYQKIKRNKREYLINWNLLFSEDSLCQIAESEEFKRGLLFIVLSENITDIFETIDAIDSVGSLNFSNSVVEIIVLEDDGVTLTWNYPSKEIQTFLFNT